MISALHDINTIMRHSAILRKLRNRQIMRYTLDGAKEAQFEFSYEKTLRQASKWLAQIIRELQAQPNKDQVNTSNRANEFQMQQHNTAFRGTTVYSHEARMIAIVHRYLNRTRSVADGD